MTAERLSALDASFLAVESDTTPMHVGWVAVFDSPEDEPRPGFEELVAHISGRLERAPRFRQRLADVPFAMHDPVWVDDAGFDAQRHLLPGAGEDLSALVDSTLSTPLPRNRPLWEIAIVDGLPDGGLALVGKMHHCMVDGTAVVELGNLLLDADPDAWREPSAEPAWSPAPVPSGAARLARAMVERAGDAAAFVTAPARVATSPRRLRGIPATVSRGARTLAHTALPPAPSSALNQPGSARRRHVRVTRSLDDIRAVRRRYRVTPNDVVLAACAGALRRYAERRGETPQPMKVMVPADVRSINDDAGGNRISFVFLELPCDEAGPAARLRAVHRMTAQRRRDRAAEDLDVAFGMLARAPTPIQHALAHAFAHPRLFNLTVSTVAGPAVPRYLHGCRLRTVHSAVPLAGRHALSIGVVMVAGQACFGLTADAHTLSAAEADAFAADIDAEIGTLLRRTST